MDLPESRIVHLAPKLAHLSPPLPAAQTALIVAQRSEARLARARPGGALGRDILATAGARVTALQSINYALERHDSAALANATQTMTILRLRLQSLGRRSRLRGC